MTFAEIIGWGKCTPPAILTNDDLSTFMDTSDEWIFSRTGIRQRHISHVPGSEMAKVASERAIACAGIEPQDIELVVYGSNSPDEMIPNSASIIVNAIGATHASGFDLNSACTSFLYSLNVATDMIKAGSVKTALVIGVEKTSTIMDWGCRDSSVLFGDGSGAVILQATEEKRGLINAKLSLVPDTREMIEMPRLGMDLSHEDMNHYYYSMNFKGQHIFKHAVKGMSDACSEVLRLAKIRQENIDFFVPHQANVRIIQTLADRMNFDMDKVMVCLDRYGNTSAASIPLALCDALETGRIKPEANVLTAAFGAGLTCGAGVIKWGKRITPIAESGAKLPVCDKTALEIIKPSIDAARKKYSE